MKTKLFFAMMLVVVLEVHAQISYINTTTLHTNVATSSGSISMPGITTNDSFTTVSSNYTIGDPLATAFGKVNANFSFIANWMGTNEAGIYSLTLTNSGSTYISIDGSTLVLNTNGFGGGVGAGSGVTNLVPTNGVSVIIGSTLFLNTNSTSGGTGNYLLQSFGTGNDLTISNTSTLVNGPYYMLLSFTLNGDTSANSNCINGNYVFDTDWNAWTNQCGTMLDTLPYIWDWDALNFLRRAGITNWTTSPSDLVESLAINTLAINMKYTGLWTNFVAIYPYVGGTINSDSQNLISSNYTITWNNILTNSFMHTFYGLSNNASRSWGDTGIPGSSYYCGAFVLTSNGYRLDFDWYALTNGQRTVYYPYDGYNPAGILGLSFFPEPLFNLQYDHPDLRASLITVVSNYNASFRPVSTNSATNCINCWFNQYVGPTNSTTIITTNIWYVTVTNYPGNTNPPAAWCSTVWNPYPGKEYFISYTIGGVCKTLAKGSYYVEEVHTLNGGGPIISGNSDNSFSIGPDGTVTLTLYKQEVMKFSWTDPRWQTTDPGTCDTCVQRSLPAGGFTFY